MRKAKICRQLPRHEKVQWGAGLATGKSLEVPPFLTYLSIPVVQAVCPKAFGAPSIVKMRVASVQKVGRTCLESCTCTKCISFERSEGAHSALTAVHA